MDIQIPYTPHPKQTEVHESKVRFKIVAAGRRSGKTILAVNELIRQAVSMPEDISRPIPRSWFICTTYRQAEMIAWKTSLKFIPEELIKSKNVAKLMIELINGHIIEFKGSEDPDKLRGVALNFAVLDEYGLMDPEIWTDVVRPMLVDTGGSALFIGTPGSDGSPHFSDIYNLGLTGDPSFKSWLFYTTDNPHIPASEIEEAKRNLPSDIFKREFQADFSVSAGLIYDNFRHTIHVIPHYEPDSSDFIVGSIDPGLHNPTAALLCAWGRDGEGRVFKEYYETEKLASQNGELIAQMAKPYKVAYWVIDKSSIRREMNGGLTVFGKFAEHLRPLLPANNNPGTVWAGIDEVKKMFHVDPKSGRPRLYITAQCHKMLWEIGRYVRYKRKWHSDKNEEEKPRKLDDHLCDCLRNMVMTRPWIRPSLRLYQPAGIGY